MHQPDQADNTPTDTSGSSAENTQKRAISLNDQTDKWSEILSLSGRMLNLARQNDWQKIDEIHQQRDQLLKGFFEQAIEQSLINIVQAGIAEIQQQDQQVVELIKLNRDALGVEAQRLQSMKKRLDQYVSAAEQKLE